MNICVCGPVNPFELKEYVDYSTGIISINRGSSSVNTFVAQLIRDGHDIIVITSDVPLDITSDITYIGEHLTIHVVNSRPGIFMHHALSRFYMVGRLKKYIKEVIPYIDVLHCQWTYDYAMASRTFEKKVPTFCTVRDWCPYIITVQSSLMKKMQWCLYYLQFRYVMHSRRITFIANSDYTRDCISRSYPYKKVPVIYNPIDQNLILRERQGYPDNPVFISIASSATEKRKNIPLLLEAFSRFVKEFPTATLLLVGGGFTQDNPALAPYQAKGWFKNVELLGQLTHQGVIDAIDQSSCLIHPALEETFGNILLEGMARRVVVIGGEHAGAVPHVLGNGDNGILCDVTNAESMVDAMRRSMEFDTTAGLIERATRNLFLLYGSEVVAKKHIDVYQMIPINR